MEEIPIAGRDDPADLVKRFFASYDVPAYARRAREVEDAYEQLVGYCRRQRDHLVRLARLRVGVLRALAGDWHALRPLVGDEQVELLRRMHDELVPVLRVPVRPTGSARVLSRALTELRESVEHFNRRWRDFLASVDLSRINALRDGYTRYYLLEKECAMRSARLARHDFRRLEPLTVERLEELFPTLPVPAVPS